MTFAEKLKKFWPRLRPRADGPPERENGLQSDVLVRKQPPARRFGSKTGSRTTFWLENGLQNDVLVRTRPPD